MSQGGFHQVVVLTARSGIADIEELGVLLNPSVKIQPTKVSEADHQHFKRNAPVNKKPEVRELANNWKLSNHSTMTEEDAVQEVVDAVSRWALTYLSIDIKGFISCIANRNYYGAAKIILSSNPLGLSCGLLCSTSDLCAGCCNLSQTHAGPININGLQEFAVRKFRQMEVKPVINTAAAGPLAPEIAALPIAMIGCGPVSISCATFLARLGYKNLTIFEKEKFGGGMSVLEIPEFRIPRDAVQFEIDMLLDLGVKVEFGKALGVDFTLESLKQSFRVVVVAVGTGAAKTIRPMDGLTKEQGYLTSKDFLPHVSGGSRKLEGFPTTLPELQGRVLVLGAGDVAQDCARAAWRCGADRVTLVMRRNTTDIRATEEEIELSMKDNVDILPYALTKQVHLKEGRVAALELFKTEKQLNQSYVKGEETFSVPCDFIISAFGSKAALDLETGIAPLKLEQGLLKVNDEGCTAMEGVFAGGDIVGNGSTVAAANDGKTAAWGIHHYLSKQVAPSLPAFFSEIDKVDVSVDMCGIHFLHPFGLASAPPATTGEMIERAFRAGWAFAVTKTFTREGDEVSNITPRIMSSVQGKAKALHWQNGFMNIELISDKAAGYWLAEIKRLKQLFPKHVVISSIMCSFKKEDWQDLTRRSVEAGADAIEMNLSCPHGMHEKGMGLALGVFPDMVKQAVEWVTEASTIPVFAKLTPNVTDISKIAQAAMDGGASGVTAINTVSGLVGFHPDATPYRLSVGEARMSTYGGLSGNSVRPLALRGVSTIARKVKGTPIMATGGIDSADVALQFLYAGASVMQVCSAVMNADYSVVFDYVTGLKQILYAMGKGNLRHIYNKWDKPLHPERRQMELKDPFEVVPKPSFGPFEEQRRMAIVKANSVGEPPEKKRRVEGEEKKTEVFTIPSVGDMIGRGLKHIGGHHDLNRNEQVLAIVDEDLCLNCGKCYFACEDNGYQAIEFDLKTHKPLVVEDKCTGCGLCESVCPVPTCITFKRRDGFLPPNRGLHH